MFVHDQTLALEFRVFDLLQAKSKISIPRDTVFDSLVADYVEFLCILPMKERFGLCSPYVEGVEMSGRARGCVSYI